MNDADLSPEEREMADGALDSLLGDLEAGSPSPALRQRLLREVEAPPWRYAPFFDRVAHLFDMPVSDVEEMFSQLADPKVFRWSGLRGVRVMPVQGGPRVADSEASLVRFEPGTRFPRHRHAGAERVIVLEGSYVDDLGVEYGPGDQHDMEEGSEHGFRVTDDEPCIAATVVAGGLHFQTLPLRVLAKILGRS